MFRAPALEPLLKPRQVAQWLNVSERGVQSMTARGVLPAIKIGRRVLRYKRSEIEQRFTTKTR